MTDASQCRLTSPSGTTVAEDARCTDNCTATTQNCDLCFICFCQVRAL